MIISFKTLTICGNQQTTNMTPKKAITVAKALSSDVAYSLQFSILLLFIVDLLVLLTSCFLLDPSLDNSQKTIVLQQPMTTQIVTPKRIAFIISIYVLLLSNLPKVKNKQAYMISSFFSASLYLLHCPSSQNKPQFVQSGKYVIITSINHIVATDLTNTQYVIC